MSNKGGGFMAILVPIALALGGAIWWGVDMHKKVSNFSGRVDSVSSKQSDSLEKVALIDFINKDMATVKEYLNKVDHTIGPLSSESHQFAQVYEQVGELSKKLNNISKKINKRVGDIESQLNVIAQEQEDLKWEIINRIEKIENTLPKRKR
jgi:methyl-accepting chemotaxis protein